MSLVKAQCRICKSVFKVDSTKYIATCPNCGTTHIVEKAINQYVTNFIGVVDKETKEKEFENAANQLETGDFQKAYGLYVNLYQKYESDPRVWDGLLNVVTKNGTITASEYYNNHVTINQYYKNLKELDAEIAQKWDEKINKWKNDSQSDKIKSVKNKELFKDLNNINKKVKRNTVIARIMIFLCITCVSLGIIGVLINFLRISDIQPWQIKKNLVISAIFIHAGLILLLFSKYYTIKADSYRKIQTDIKIELEKYKAKNNSLNLNDKNKLLTDDKKD